MVGIRDIKNAIYNFLLMLGIRKEYIMESLHKPWKDYSPLPRFEKFIPRSCYTKGSK